MVNNWEPLFWMFPSGFVFVPPTSKNFTALLLQIKWGFDEVKYCLEVPRHGHPKKVVHNCSSLPSKGNKYAKPLKIFQKKSERSRPENLCPDRPD